ncbi:hypothetical protein AWJ20_2904 [Sugiyamaella lignohabitans]|uniref:Uncharacterized protein n=1 Tax=Sugiyamaella lignohabitans TaxID=796027 RepID=A0A167FGQ4_9ASCO|nr:uncharacterized protein AWJ20_2904 [Sugiyamaella lignohabitans]ANB15278.1 hypothetical protein AWJ20_2904 [Sugiyamaella lignohabitans]
MKESDINDKHVQGKMNGEKEDNLVRENTEDSTFVSGLAPSLIPMLPSPSPSPTDSNFVSHLGPAEKKETPLAEESRKSVTSSSLSQTPADDINSRLKAEGHSSSMSEFGTPGGHVADQIRLRIKKVIGTTAQSKSAFCTVGPLITYTAGAGSVLARLDTSNGSVVSQRFFCTSTKVVQMIQAAANSPTSLSWSTWRTMFDASSIPALYNGGVLPRDSYGYLIVGAENPNRPGTVLTPILPSGQNNDDTLSVLGGNSPAAGDYPHSPGSRSVPSAKDKMKTTSSVALSSDGKLLAVGEVGHQPRIFIYSTAPDSSSLPLAILNEHRFGIKSLAFSPCNKYLASLGTTNDGFLHIWSLALKEGSIRLHATNRCISVINDMKWMGPSSYVVTVGVRHVRLWSVDGQNSTAPINKKQQIDPKAGVLSGRNVVLGDFSQATFTTVVAISDNMAIVATDVGDVATLECNNDDKPVFKSRMGLGFEISAVDVDIFDHIVWVACANGTIR